MLAICAGIAVGIMVAIGGSDGVESGGIAANVVRDAVVIQDDSLSRDTVQEQAGSLSSTSGLSMQEVSGVSTNAGPTRLVIGGLATGDGEPEPAVTAAAVEPTRDIVEPNHKDYLSVGPADIIALIVQYDWPDDTAIAIADCESDFNPNAYNASGASGIYQFLGSFHNWKLRAGETWFDAGANIRIAYETWLADGGFSAWNASRHCWGN